MVGMQMRDEDVRELGQPDRADELALRALAAVEEDPVAAAAHEQRGEPAARRRGGAGGSGEEDGQVHRCAPERSVGALLAVVCALLVLCAPAQAAPRPGVVADLPLTEADYAHLHESGVKVVRLFMFTADYNDPGFRQVVGRLHALGIKVLFVVVGDQAHPPAAPHARARFAAFVRARAAEFRGKVEGWEIWNEEDAPQWWAGAPPVDGV